MRALLKGATVIVTAADIQQLSALGTDRVAASPAQVDNLCKAVKPPSRKIPVLSVAGAAMTPSLIRGWLRYFERIEMSYGSQETWRGGRLTVTKMDDDDVVAYSIDDDVRIEIVDEAGAQCPANAIGIVRIKTPEMVAGYVGAPEATAEAFKDGWFYPGDLGSIAEDGRLRINGRTADQFNFGGVKANAEDIDDIAGKAGGVAAAISFSRSVEGGLDELCVLAILAGGTTPEDAAAHIRQSCRSLRGRDLVPKAIYFTTSLPLNENGKAMREMAQQIASAAIAY